MNQEKNNVLVKFAFETYLKSIGGLENGFYPDRPAIMERDFFDVNDGWIPMIQELIQELVAAGWNKQVCQVKEKFGGLRFYINDGSEEVDNIISKYEQVSVKTCEVCGEPGELVKAGWWSTLCDKHKKKDDTPSIDTIN